MRTVQTQNFVNIVGAVFEIWTKNINNGPKIVVFNHLWPPRISFKNQALSLLYPYGALTSCKKLEKSKKQSLRYLKTDHGLTHQRTDEHGWLHRTPSGKPGSKMLMDKIANHHKSLIEVMTKRIILWQWLTLSTTALKIKRKQVHKTRSIIWFWSLKVTLKCLKNFLLY